MQAQFAIHCWVSGRVQGVSYRIYTKKQARALGLTGWVKNLSDGRVEVFICGDEAIVWQMHAWLKQGPPLAVVAEVAHEVEAWCEYEQFDIVD